MYDRILVPLDGSQMAEAVISHAEAIARAFQSRIILFQAIKPLDAIVGETLPWGTLNPEADTVPVGVARAKFDEGKNEANAYMNPVALALASRGLSAETKIGEGDPADAILASAAAESISLIVMATHGRGGIGRLVMGSVADAVLRHSTIPVLLVHNGPS